jgi:hypothetical protein
MRFSQSAEARYQANAAVLCAVNRETIVVYSHTDTDIGRVHRTISTLTSGTTAANFCLETGVAATTAGNASAGFVTISQVSATTTAWPCVGCVVGTGSVGETSGHWYQPKIVFDEVRFNELVQRWRRARNSLSSSAWDNVRLPEYQQIIGMGPAAIPLILAELRDELKKGEPDDWFIALWAITQGENPVPEESRGNLKEMAKAWLDWGSRQ